MRTRVILLLLVLIGSGCVSNKRLFQGGKPLQTNIYGEVPFDYSRNLPILEVQIKGKTYRFLFDTGAPMVISPAINDALGLKPLVKRGVKDSQGARQTLPYTRLPEVTLGGHTFLDLVAIVADLQLAPEIRCLGIDGIVGANLMRHMVWNMDYEKGLLSFSDQEGAFRVDSTAILFPFLFKPTFTPIISVTANGVKYDNITFDTGYAGAFNLEWTRAGVLAADSLPITVGYHAAGIFGSVLDTVAYTRVSLSDSLRAIDGVPLVMEKSNGNSLMGSAYLAKFRVVMDWNKRVIALHPKPDRPFTSSNTFGFQPRLRNDTLIVGNVMPGSRADSLGFKVGTPIESLLGIQGTPITPDDYCELLMRFRTSQPDSVQVRLLGGENVTLRPKLFY